MKWFERHLNWTLVIGGLIALSPWCIRAIIDHDGGPWDLGATVLLFPVVMGVADELWFRPPPYLLPMISATAFVSVLLSAWVLHRKRQSLWWLPVAWIPYMGWVIPMALENRRLLMSGGDWGACVGGGPACREDGNARSPHGGGTSKLVWFLLVVSTACTVVGALLSVHFLVYMVIGHHYFELMWHDLDIFFMIDGKVVMAILLVLGVVLAGVALKISEAKEARMRIRRAWMKAAMAVLAAVFAVNVIALAVFKWPSQA